METLAQIIGVVASVAAIVSYQFRHKWQMLGICSLANFLSGVNFLLLGNAGVMTANSFIAAIQCIINAIRSYFGKKDAGIFEKIIVFGIFLAIGIIQYKTPLDLMPLAAAMLFVLSTFRKSEQEIRVIIFFNTAILLVYSVIMGSSVVIGHIFSIISIVSSYIRERKVSCEK